MLVFLGLAVALASAEGFARWVSPVPSEYLLPLPYKHDELLRIAAGDAYVRFDRELGWTPAINVVRKDHDVVYRTNRDAMRADIEYSIDPIPGRSRVAAFGDSFTYCEEVDFDDCWTSQLEHAWNQTEILNFGVPGFAPDQAWLHYARDGRKYHPCAVLIGLIPENINRIVNRFRPFYEPAGGLVLSKPRFVMVGDDLELLPNPAESPEMLDDPVWVETNLEPNDQWYFPGTFVGNPLDALQLVRILRTAAFNRRPQGLEFSETWAKQLAHVYRDRGDALGLMAEILKRFAAQVRMDGATPVVVLFGTEIELREYRSGQSPFYEPLVERLTEEDVAVIDTLKALANEKRQSGVDSIIEHHYRPLGNRVIAEELARKLPNLTAATCGGSN